MNNVNTPSVQSFNCYHVLSAAHACLCVCVCVTLVCVCVFGMHLQPRCIHLRLAKFCVAYTTHCHSARSVSLRQLCVCVCEGGVTGEKTFSFCILFAFKLHFRFPPFHPPFYSLKQSKQMYAETCNYLYIVLASIIFCARLLMKCRPNREGVKRFPLRVAMK